VTLGVKRVEDARGQRLDSPKIDSSGGALTIHLEPAHKVIGELRTLFPRATLVGWKYELNGKRQDALARAWSQIKSNRTDACVLNGQAWGSGFALCTPPDQISESRQGRTRPLPARLVEGQTRNHLMVRQENEQRSGPRRKPAR
jgi:hypothetical protein